MLAQLVMLAFGLFAILALVVDVGHATLARVQLQHAADTAAVEAVRLRNVGRTVVDESADGFVNDCLRRASARNMVAWTFDDDFVTASDALSLGAGAVITLDGGDAEVNAGQRIDENGLGVFKPSLQPNQAANARHGDIVSGSFAYTASPLIVEDSAYDRTDGTPAATPDFTPGIPVPPGTSTLTGCPTDDPVTALPDFTGIPGSGATAIQDDAVLVRLRRTASPRAARRNPLDSDPGVSSSGPTLPLFFARGGLMPAAEADETVYSPRHDGLAVRATAISRVAPARRIGVRAPQAPEMGAVAFALDATCWNLSAWGVTPVGSGNPDEVWATIDAHPLAGGREFWTLRTSACVQAGYVVPLQAWRVGDGPTAMDLLAGTEVTFDEAGFTPVYTPIAAPGGGGVERVVAFGRARLSGSTLSRTTCAPASPADTGCLRLIRRNVSTNLPRVAPQNASATLPDGFPAGLSTAEIQAVTAAATGVQAALLAPVLAR